MLGTELFKKADANRDGKVSLDEVPESRREGFKKLLEKADKDGDHSLSVEEARRLAAGAAERVNELRKQFLAKMAERQRAVQGPPGRRGPGGDSEMRRGGRRGPPGAVQGPPGRPGPGGDSEMRRGGWRGPPGAMQGPPRGSGFGDAMPGGRGGQRGLWDGW
jgi:hypothetical protein